LGRPETRAGFLVRLSASLWPESGAAATFRRRLDRQWRAA
jgi:hypothetical protein